jgi:hypothetical protein
MEYVGFHDRDPPTGPEPATKGVRVTGVKLYGDDASARAREGIGDPPGSGSKLQHEIRRADARLGHQFAGQRPAA